MKLLVQLSPAGPSTQLTVRLGGDPGPVFDRPSVAARTKHMRIFSCETPCETGQPATVAQTIGTNERPVKAAYS
jgi:hypothetical protein